MKMELLGTINLEEYMERETDNRVKELIKTVEYNAFLKSQKDLSGYFSHLVKEDGHYLVPEIELDKILTWGWK